MLVLSRSHLAIYTNLNTFVEQIYHIVTQAPSFNTYFLGI